MDEQQFIDMLNGLESDERRYFAQLALGTVVTRIIYPRTTYDKVEVSAIGNEFAETPHMHLVTIYDRPGYAHPREYYGIRLTDAICDARAANPDADSQHELDKVSTSLIYYIKEPKFVPWFDYPIRSRSSFYEFPRIV
jgi:hypothetical protein